MPPALIAADTDTSLTTGAVVDQVDDNPDRALDPEAARRVADGLAANTSRAYAHDWTRFTAWCATTGRRPLPATAETLANYVTALAA